GDDLLDIEVVSVQRHDTDGWPALVVGNVLRSGHVIFYMKARSRFLGQDFARGRLQELAHFFHPNSTPDVSEYAVDRRLFAGVILPMIEAQVEGSFLDLFERLSNLGRRQPRERGGEDCVRLRYSEDVGLDAF